MKKIKRLLFRSRCITMTYRNNCNLAVVMLRLLQRRLVIYILCLNFSCAKTLLITITTTEKYIYYKIYAVCGCAIRYDMRCLTTVYDSLRIQLPVHGIEWPGLFCADVPLRTYRLSQSMVGLLSRRSR